MKSGLLDTDGRVIVPIAYEHISASRDMLSRRQFEFKENGKIGIGNFDGVIDVEPRYDGMGEYKNNLYITISKPDEHSYYNGLIKDNGQKVLPMTYRRIDWIDEDLLLLEDDNGCMAVKYCKK